MPTFDFGSGEVPAHRHPSGGGWVADSAIVESTAFVGTNARVYGNARVRDNARVYDNAWVYGNAQVYGNAWVCDGARVCGNARVYGNAVAYGNARVYDNARVFGNAKVYGNARVYDGARVCGNARVCDDARVYEGIVVSDNVGEPPVVATHRCRYCENDHPQTAEFWYRNRATGGLHLNGRCHSCEREYRANRRRIRAASGARDTPASGLALVPMGSERKFGIEAEFIGSRARVASRLTALGQSCERQGYNHETLDYWKAITDDSVQGGGELVSPPLSGNSGRDAIVLAGRAFQGAGASVNSSCGFHVHHEVMDLSAEQIVRVVENYCRSQEAFNQLVSSSRRGSRGYCDYIPLSEVANLKNAASLGLSRLKREMEYQNRYRVVNVASYSLYGTLEFRQHQGTIDAQKMIAWVALGQALIEASKAGWEFEATTAESLVAALGDHLHPEVGSFLRNRATQLATPSYAY